MGETKKVAVLLGPSTKVTESNSVPTTGIKFVFATYAAFGSAMVMKSARADAAKPAQSNSADKPQISCLFSMKLSPFLQLSTLGDDRIQPEYLGELVLHGLWLTVLHDVEVFRHCVFLVVQEQRNWNSLVDVIQTVVLGIDVRSIIPVVIGVPESRSHAHLCGLAGARVGGNCLNADVAIRGSRRGGS